MNRRDREREKLKDCLENSMIAVVAEGWAEAAVIDLLLDSNSLIFTRDNLFKREVLTGVRNVRKLSEAVQGYDYGETKLLVIRILDSKNEKFVPNGWLKKNIRNENGEERRFDIVTSPEIEILIILSENLYKGYEQYLKQARGKSGTKPSNFCKIEKKLKYHKDYEFWIDYFSDHRALIQAIKLYNQKFGNSENLNLYDLLSEDATL